ncbi:hypothetical protein SAY87_028251 [Trapa incisa]|uniref:Uncharacterized protein n=1 Tax=Trapa incisa TaxID=236973 RepID=A0AAN7KTN2_9MYRT|nr:hypothetical protein SAY87_028251 [Trapa incisa]
MHRKDFKFQKGKRQFVYAKTTKRTIKSLKIHYFTSMVTKYDLKIPLRRTTIAKLQNMLEGFRNQKSSTYILHGKERTNTRTTQVNSQVRNTPIANPTREEITNLFHFNQATRQRLEMQKKLKCRAEIPKMRGERPEEAAALREQARSWTSATGSPMMLGTAAQLCS